MMVLVDRLSILQLLRILLDNAWKYTGPGGTVVVSATVSKDLVLLAVEDSGIGIAPEHQDRVFERFYRVNGDTNRTGTGAGLGLSLARSIAEQHKTRLTLDSALGHGCRFQIDLARVHINPIENDGKSSGLSPEHRTTTIGTAFRASIKA